MQQVFDRSVWLVSNPYLQSADCCIAPTVEAT